MVAPDPALFEPVAKPRVEIATNEDLERKATRMEAALDEANARLGDVKAAIDNAVEQAKQLAATSQPPANWMKFFWRKP